MKQFVFSTCIIAVAYFATLICGSWNVAYSQPSQPQKNFSANNSSSGFQWELVEPGFWRGRYALPKKEALIAPEVFLLKFQPPHFMCHLVTANEVGLKRADVRTMTKKIGGIAGINTNFFDEVGDPLGLVIKNEQGLNKLHRGGNVLTGIFFMDDKKPSIVHRDEFQNARAQLAFQSGPRLIAGGRAVQISSSDAPNRRSGLALARNSEIILYATLLRFPGATLSQLQEMLLDPQLEIIDALNLDGGGSSQLFMEKNALGEAVYISGGDLVPVALVMTRKD